MRVVIGAFMAAALVAGAGCTRENHDVTVVPGGPGSCTSNAQCGGGLICTTMGCCPGCHSDSDCAADQACVSGAPNFCAPKGMNPTVVDPGPTGPGSTVQPGTFCAADAECGSGRLCNVGRCIAMCSGSSCGSGQQCLAGRCYLEGATACGISGAVLCNASSQCGVGRTCASGQCTSSCESSAQCGLGQTCQSSLCKDGPALTAQCNFDQECGVAFRCINAYCHPLCSSDEQCGSTNFCDQGVCRANNRPI